MTSLTMRPSKPSRRRPRRRVWARPSIRSALRRLNLQAYYSAINVRWFDGRLPTDVLIRWKTQKQLEKVKGMHHVYGYAGITKDWKQQIVLNIDSHAQERGCLLKTFVHESIHLLMPFGDLLSRKSSYADTTNTSHGEDFGAEARRINSLLGYKLMTDEECSYGIAGRKWAYDNVSEKCGDVDYVDECGIDTAIHCEFCGTKREMRKHKKEHETRHSAWCEKFDSKWDSNKSDFIDGLNDEYVNFKNRVWVTVASKLSPSFRAITGEVVRLWKEHRQQCPWIETLQ